MRDTDTQVWVNDAARTRIEELEREVQTNQHALNNTSYQLTKCRQRVEWLESEVRRLELTYETAEEL